MESNRREHVAKKKTPSFRNDGQNLLDLAQTSHNKEPIERESHLSVSMANKDNAIENQRQTRQTTEKKTNKIKRNEKRIDRPFRGAANRYKKREKGTKKKHEKKTKTKEKRDVDRQSIGRRNEAMKRVARPSLPNGELKKNKIK